MDVSHEDKADYLRWAGVRYVYAPLHFEICYFLPLTSYKMLDSKNEWLCSITPCLHKPKLS